MILLALVLAPETLPFGSVVTLPSGSVKSYSVTIQNPNRFGDWAPSENGYFPPVQNGTLRFLSGDDKGHHGSTVVTFNSIPQWVSTDGRKIDHAPTWKGNSFRKGYVSVMDGYAYGRYLTYVWSESALTVQANDCRLFIRSLGSPTRGLYIKGDDNDVTVEIEQGQQSNLILDLAGVTVRGKGNTVRGYIKAELCGLMVHGDDNRALDLSISVDGIGADRGGVHVVGHRFRATNVVVRSAPRKFPRTHLDAAFYLDERSNESVLFNCTAIGPWEYGFFSHGGSNGRVERFRSMGPKEAVRFDPHFTTPALLPTGNVSRSVVEAR